MATSPKDGLIIGVDGAPRCSWHGNDPEYLRYHDVEWGTPVSSDRHLFEKICLEGFQAGLSWLTILRKRENLRAAFDNFDASKISTYREEDIARLLANAGIIRHRAKIEAVINNAQKLPEILDEFGSFAAYIWRYEQPLSTRPPKCDYATLSQITISAQSTALSKDLKKRGWKFVGPTTCYAFMQSMGMVNDHVEGCIGRAKTEEMRKHFKRPATKSP